MAQRNPAVRLALVIAIIALMAGIYMLWRHTRFMVDRDKQKSNGTMMLPPHAPASGSRAARHARA